MRYAPLYLVIKFSHSSCPERIFRALISAIWLPEIQACVSSERELQGRTAQTIMVWTAWFRPTVTNVANKTISGKPAGKSVILNLRVSGNRD